VNDCVSQFFRCFNYEPQFWTIIFLKRWMFEARDDAWIVDELVAKADILPSLLRAIPFGKQI